MEVKNLIKVYANRRNTNRVINGISLSFKRGQIVFIVGRSGCGKSTLLNLIGGLESADNGSIVFDGKNITHGDIEYKRKCIGFVFQDYNLVTGMNIGQNIALASKKYDKDWIDDNAQTLGLRTMQKVETLSGGEKQRVALLRALYKDADIVLADEPTGNLDSKTSSIVFEQFRKLKEQNKIVVVVTHDLESAKKYGDRIVELQDGLVLSDVNIGTKSIVATNDLPVLKHAACSNKNYKANVAIVTNSLKQRLVRVLSVVIILALSISFVAVALDLFVGATRIHSSMIGYLDADLVTASLGTTPDNSSLISGRPIGQNIIEDINNRNDVNAVIPSFNDIRVGVEANGRRSFPSLSFSRMAQVSIREQLITSHIMQIDHSNFFRDRIMSFGNVQGSFLSAPNQIILGLDTAEDLFGSDVNPIGQAIYARPSSASTSVLFNDIVGLPLQIVGINSSQNFEGFYLNFIHFDMVRQIMQANNSLEIIQDATFSFNPVGVNWPTGTPTAPIVVPAAVKNINITSENITSENLLSGTLPTSNDEVVVHRSVADSIEEHLGDYHNRAFFVIFSNWRTDVAPIRFLVKIVGVFDNEDISFSISMPKSLFEEQVVKVVPSFLGIYIAHPERHEQFIDSLKVGENYFDASSNYSHFINQINNMTVTLRAMIQLLSFALAMIVLVVIIVLVKLGVTERVYEMAVYRSLGFKRNRIYCLFIYEILIQFIVATIIAFSVSLLLTSVVLPALWKELSFIAIGVPTILIVLTSVTMLTISIAGTILFVRNLATQKIASLFRKKNA